MSGRPRSERERIFQDEVVAAAKAAINACDANLLVHICHENWRAFQDNASLLSWLGVSLLRFWRPIEALPLLEAATQLAPESGAVWHNISSALIQVGREEEAVKAFSRKCSPLTNDLKASRDFIHEYEEMAGDYDRNSLHQFFTEFIIGFYSRIFPGRRLRKVLELGCGTGLLGTRLPASATTACGIDLSPDMLRIAESRELYDRLIQGDLVEVMSNLTESFDSVFSAGVLCYFADLRPIFTQVWRLLAPEGVFVFSVDPLGDDDEIGVTGPGEYCHSRRYLRALATEVGLEEKMIEIAPHRGSPGFWCAFKKR